MQRLRRNVHTFLNVTAILPYDIPYVNETENTFEFRHRIRLQNAF